MRVLDRASLILGSGDAGRRTFMNSAPLERSGPAVRSGCTHYGFVMLRKTRARPRPQLARIRFWPAQPACRDGRLVGCGADRGVVARPDRLGPLPLSCAGGTPEGADTRKAPRLANWNRRTTRNRSGCATTLRTRRNCSPHPLGRTTGYPARCRRGNRARPHRHSRPRPKRAGSAAVNRSSGAIASPAVQTGVWNGNIVTRV